MVDEPKRREPKEKETDEIKELLRGYQLLQRRIDNTERRMEQLCASMGAPVSARLTGMPGVRDDSSSRVEREVIRKTELEERLLNMYREEHRQREYIEALVERLEDPNQQTAIEMRYLDGTPWAAVSAALYGDRLDYDELERRYIKATHKVHSAALLALSRLHRQLRKEGNHGG